MPLPWKKMKKNTRLSQMLSDSIHQRRRSGGSPLVVETGFPASLIDLFVKNKERLKKPSKKTNIYPPPLPSAPSRFTDTVVDDDHDDSLICSSSSSSSGLNVNSSRSSSPFHPRCHNVNDSSIIDGNDRRVSQEGVDANRVLVAIFRMFLVVVLILGVNNFVLGITLSAFLLVFLECVGKHTGTLLVPCTWIRNKLIREKGNVEQEKLLSLPSCTRSVNQDRDFSMSQRIREINSCSVYSNDEIVCETEKNDGGVQINHGEALNLNKVVAGEEEKRCELVKLKTRKSCKSRIKLKMKDLVPKKFRNSKKQGREVEKGKSLVVADILATPEEDEYENTPDQSDSSSWMSRELDDVKERIDSNNGYVQLLEDGKINPEEEKIKIEHKFDYVFLVLIVLVGLICGRISALILALTWCLMKKSGGNLRQYIKRPFLGSIVKGSG